MASRTDYTIVWSNEQLNDYIMYRMTFWPDRIDELIWDNLTELNIIHVLFSFDAVALTQRDLERVIERYPMLYNRHRVNIDKYMEFLK